MCQRPKRAFFISTRQSGCIEALKSANALNGLSSFLLYLHSKYRRNLLCVNALNGLSSFLPSKAPDCMLYLALCQRPKRAFFISTIPLMAVRRRLLEVCQRPKRAFFISTIAQQEKCKRYNFSVNALNGLSSFLLFWRKSLTQSDDMCQRPKRAFFISPKITISRRRKTL